MTVEERHSQSRPARPWSERVDVARFGDDQTVIGDRQGRKARILKKFRGLDTEQVAQRLLRFSMRQSPKDLTTP